LEDLQKRKKDLLEFLVRYRDSATPFFLNLLERLRNQYLATSNGGFRSRMVLKTKEIRQQDVLLYLICRSQLVNFVRSKEDPIYSVLFEDMDQLYQKEIQKLKKQEAKLRSLIVMISQSGTVEAIIRYKAEYFRPSVRELKGNYLSKGLPRRVNYLVNWIALFSKPLPERNRIRGYRDHGSLPTPGVKERREADIAGAEQEELARRYSSLFKRTYRNPTPDKIRDFMKRYQIPNHGRKEVDT